MFKMNIVSVESPFAIQSKYQNDLLYGTPMLTFCIYSSPVCLDISPAAL